MNDQNDHPYPQFNRTAQNRVSDAIVGQLDVAMRLLHHMEDTTWVDQSYAVMLVLAELRKELARDFSLDEKTLGANAKMGCDLTIAQRATHSPLELLRTVIDRHQKKAQPPAGRTQ